MSQLNLPRGTNNKKVERQEKKLKSKKTGIGKQSAESAESVLKKKRKARVGRIRRKCTF